MLPTVCNGKFLNYTIYIFYLNIFIICTFCEVKNIFRKGGLFYDTLGAEVPKIAICLLSPHLLMEWADFWYGGSFLVELPLKVAIFPFSPPPPLHYGELSLMASRERAFKKASFPN